MVPYIKKVLMEFPERIAGESSAPVADRLFQVCPPLDAKLLPEEQAQAFYHTSTQLLFISCVRRNIQATAAFLTTQVKAPDEDDWGKLKQVLPQIPLRYSPPPSHFVS